MISSIKPKIILHVARLQNAECWTSSLISHAVTDFDIPGLSHYAKWSTIKTMDEVQNKTRALKTTYGKQVMVVETAYPRTGNYADNYTILFLKQTKLPVMILHRWNNSAI